MERSIVTTCLVGCITLGFLSLVAVYVPSQLSQAKGPLPVAEFPAKASPSLSDIVEQMEAPPPPEAPTPMGAPVMTQDESEQPAGEGIATLPPEQDQEEMVVASARHHPWQKWDRKKSQKVPVTKVSKNFPLKIYEPLEETLHRHYAHGLLVTQELKPSVDFWRNVYGNYDLQHTLLHDNRNLDIVYGVLNFTPLEEDPTLSPEERHALRENIEESKKEELHHMLTRFSQGELPHTAGEHVIYSLFEAVEEPNKFARAAERIRSQWGQKDRFMAGVVRAGRYMPMIEEIFIREGVPKEITRLVFVESMFQLGALSKVGAAGPFQFMPGTARLYMTLNNYVDERLDPLMAAQAAAKLLLKNYGQVGSWPLAINGYNTGILRMVKAAERLQTHDIATIIEHFEDSGYQFASRNFYPEFLAALEVYDNHPKYFGKLDREEPVLFDEIILPYHTSLHRLAAATAMDVNILKDLNPAYDEKLFSPQAIIPKGYTLRVPHQQKMVFLAALDQIQSEEKQVQWHIVGKGENLKQIAARYQIPPALLRSHNHLLDNRLRRGQMLKIPSPPSEVVLDVRR